MVAKSRIVAVLLGLPLIISGCEEPKPAVYAPPVDTRPSSYAISKMLQQGMAEEQVIALREPDKITLETCGQNTGRPWTCKAYHYGLYSLTVLFTNVNGRWLVNSWF